VHYYDGFFLFFFYRAPSLSWIYSTAVVERRGGACPTLGWHGQDVGQPAAEKWDVMAAR
jgi:hypothetical protein